MGKFSKYLLILSKLTHLFYKKIVFTLVKSNKYIMMQHITKKKHILNKLLANKDIFRLICKCAVKKTVKKLEADVIVNKIKYYINFPI